jgi:hypothetical protein
MIYSLKTYEVPLSFLPHPFVFTPIIFAAGPVAGSDHSRSHSSPASGMGVGRFKSLIYDKSVKLGEIPPCMHRILSSIRAATGSSLNRLTNSLQSLTEYLLLHSSQKPYNLEMFWHSWLPLSINTPSGYLIL